MQTEEEMKAQLLDAGPGRRRASSRATAARSKARRWRSSAARWPRMEDSLVALERRGISLRAHAVRQDPVTGQLPDLPRLPRQPRALVHHAASELDDFRRPAGRGGRRRADRRRSARRPAAAATRRSTRRRQRPGRPALHIVELHEVRTINTMLADLAQDGLRRSQALIPQERTGSEEPRYTLRRGENDDRPGRSARPAAGHPRRRRKGPARSPASKAWAK